VARPRSQRRFTRNRVAPSNGRRAGRHFAWTSKDAGRGFGQPAVVGDRVYILGALGADLIEHVIALDTNGRKLWATPIAKAYDFRGKRLVARAEQHAERRWSAHGPGECHFLLGFDNGNFSEFGTFSITDWISKTPRRIAARTMQLPESVVAGLPQGEVYITQGKVPKFREPFRNPNLESSQLTHKYRLAAHTPRRFAGGEERIVSSLEFPIQTTLTSVKMDLEPGALREMHWHPNSDEWQYYTKGRARVGIFGGHGRVETAELGPGDVCFIPQGFGHWVEQLGGDATELVILFNNPLYTEISLSQWLAANPASLLADNFGLTAQVIDRLPKAALGILK